jgi:hypothetical protein
MNRLTVTMADSANAGGLDGQWADILEAGTHDGEAYTPDDLDGMVDDYQRRGDSGKAPVALGAASQTNASPVGKVDALRRKGNTLQAKFTGIDPRVEQLHARGVLPKKSIQLKRSPDGVSLQRVGLIHPVFRGRWRDDETPSLDELMKQNMGDKEHIFSESRLADQWLELFRSGDYGDKGTFSDSDLDEIVRNFDPSFHEPPAVIGHPTQDAPAYGWVAGLQRSGSKLLGRLRQVDPNFEEMVKSGRFKKRSIALYQTGKGWMLRHVGFLGAQPPEVKGLANATFREDRIRFVTLIFGESASSAEAAVRRLKDGRYWMPEFDRFKFPAMFSELEGTPALDVFVSFLERWQDECGIDENSARLAHRARNFTRFHNVSFGEALDQVTKMQAQDAALSSAVDADLPGARLTQLAYAVVRSRGVSFEEALTEVAQENPELTR